MAIHLLLSSLGIVASVRVLQQHRADESGTWLTKCSPPLQDFDGKGCFYKCESDLTMPIVAPSRKGLALDDTTLHYCAENAFSHWPNTDQPVTSFRMFKAWASWWNEPWASKKKAWRALAAQLKAVDGKVLVGTQISCNETEDDADWKNVLAMVKVFGAKRIMGLAIGNELELLWTKEGILGDQLPSCLNRMWNEGYLLDKFHSRVRDFDKLGRAFKTIKVTSVFGGFILAEPGYPFYENPERARITTFLRNVTSVFADRYAHTVNIYPYFEENFVAYDDPSAEHKTCEQAMDFGKCFAAENPDHCNFAWMVKRTRERLEALGNVDATLWIGETGWSYPKAVTLGTKMSWCDSWSTQESFAEYYQNFLDWDLNLGGKYRGPDHVFYFTMRDSQNFGKVEGFGLVGHGDDQQWCTNTTCKIQQSSMPPTRSTRVGKGYLQKIAAVPPPPEDPMASVGDMVEILPSTRMSRRCKAFVGKKGKVITVDAKNIWRYQVLMSDYTKCWMHKDDVSWE